MSTVRDVLTNLSDSTPSRAHSIFQSSSIVPAPSAPTDTLVESSQAAPAAASGAPLTHACDKTLSFTQAFGVLGLPMLVVVLACILWTAWLIVLACAPTWTANYLMSTESFDDGNFWLIVDAAPALTALSVAGLALVELGYVYVLLKMLVWRNHDASAATSFSKRIQTWSSVERLASRIPGRQRARGVLRHWSDLTGFSGSKRRYWNVCLKTVDLALQTLALAQMLESGSPTTLTRAYAALIAANALSCAMTILLGNKHSAFVEVLVDSVFDLLFAVAAPIVVLANSYSSFNFDRHELAINIAVLPEGSFERQARTLADPSELFLFRSSFDSLRILSITDLWLRVGMNLSFCYRSKRVVEVQIARRTRKMQRELARQRAKSETAVLQTAVPRVVALLFVAFACAVVGGTSKAVRASAAACAAYPQCVVFAHRWSATSDACPCLILIDANKEPKTYDEWTDPIDALEVVRQLAKTGDLHILQLINRRLVELPDELRRCANMHHVSLIYTETQSLPSWMKELKHLEFLHVEGKIGGAGLVSLPDDLFVHMHTLAMLHFGIHPRLTQLPSLGGLTGLKELTLAFLLSLTELPALASLTKLKRIILVYLPSVVSIPDLTPLTRLHEFATNLPMQICCNGFLGASACDLTHLFCTPNAAIAIPPVRCLAHDSALVATAGTLRVLEKNAASVCQGATTVATPVALTRDATDMCGGVRFRQCEVAIRQADGSTAVIPGMCAHTHFQVLACSLDPLKVAVRKVQIERRVGPVCDPQYEAWLGCGV